MSDYKFLGLRKAMKEDGDCFAVLTIATKAGSLRKIPLDVFTVASLVKEAAGMLSVAIWDQVGESER